MNTEETIEEALDLIERSITSQRMINTFSNSHSSFTGMSVLRCLQHSGLDGQS